MAKERTHIGRYALGPPLGIGGMGVVYLAHDPQLDREVALKVIRANRSGDTQARARLAREARSMARLSHPNVVHVYDAGVFEDEDGAPRVFIAMERVVGHDLQEHLRAVHATEEFARGERTEELVRLFLLAGRGLAVAHEAGLVHRDFKPANVFVSQSGEVRVGDFGLARPVDEEDARAMEEGVRASSLPDDASVTRGAVGTPGYMAPEIVIGEPSDERADQYAFCVSLYEALYAERPVQGATMAALVLATLENVVQPAPDKPKVDPRLRAILLRGLSKDPADRWASIPELLDALEAALGRGPARRRFALAVAAVGAVGLLAYSAGSSHVGDPCAEAGAEVTRWEGLRDEIGASFEATDAPFASRSWDATRTRLQTYAGTLQDEYRAACEATARGTQSEAMLDRRVSCLDRRQQEFVAITDELRRADARVVAEAPSIAGNLPELSPCRSDQLINASLPDASDAAPVADLQARMASLRAQIELGRIEQMRADAVALSEDAQRVEFLPVRAEARLLRGVAESAAGEFALAHESLREAFRLATAAGDDELALNATTRLIDLSAVELGRPGEGAAWVDVALGIQARLGDRDDIAIAIATHRSRQQNALGHRDVALELARDALTRAESRFGLHALELAPILASIGDIQGKLRDYVGSAETARRAIAVLAALGDQHPNAIAAKVRLAAALAGAGRADEARELIAEAVERAEQSLPADHPVLAKARTRQGDVLSMTGDAQAALPVYARALEDTERVYGERHSEVARVMLNMAGAMHRTGRTEDALATWRDSLTMREALLGEDHPDLAIILQNLGSVLTEEGRLDAALPLLERAHRIRFGHPTSAQGRADIEYWLGRALFEAGRDRVASRERVVAARDASLEGGYANPAQTMDDWLAAHPL